MNNRNIISIFTAILLIISAYNAYAELFNSPANKNVEVIDNADDNNHAKKSTLKIDAATASHLRSMTSSCVSHWENKECLKELSALSMDVATNYAERLDASKKTDAMENLKQHCAASTAALKVSVPAYAMKSAITECVNIISDINAKTSIKPNVNLYQLLVGSVICLGKDLACDNIETQLSNSME